MNDKLKILYIEDDELDIDLTKHALAHDYQGSKINLETCTSGEAVMELIEDFARNPQKAPPDVILLDLHLPKMDGWAILSQLKASSSLRAVPVVLLSTATSYENVERAKKEGAQAFHSKPIGLDGYRALFKSVIELCASKRS